jgi:hypothetical protein
MLLGLGALLDDFGRHADGAGGDFAETGGEHVAGGLAETRIVGVCGGRARGGGGFDAVVDDEEERCARGGADDRGPDAVVDAPEAAGGPEAGRGLEAGFDRVEGEEGGVDGGAGYGACLGG